MLIEPVVNSAFVSSPSFCQSISHSGKFYLDLCRNMKTDLKQLQETNQALSNQLDDLEQHTRMTNIRIYGVTDNIDNRLRTQMFYG